MKASDVDWRSGRVTYWSLDAVDQSKRLLDQLELLQEDLVQVEFPGGFLLDVGWYPACSEDGGFGVVVVRDRDWGRPVFDERPTTLLALRASLDRAVLIAAGEAP